MTTSKRKPGRTIPEASRHSVQMKLRLPPEVAAELRRRGLSHPRGASGVVAGLLAESLERVGTQPMHSRAK